MSEAGPSAEDWFATARSSLAAAEHLVGGQHWQHAYITAGHAVECALKGLIMRRQGLNRWPASGEDRRLYTHNLSRLAELAQVTGEIEAEALAGTELGGAWMVAKDFDINRRYPAGGAFPYRVGRDMVEAAGKRGLVTWLTTRK